MGVSVVVGDTVGVFVIDGVIVGVGVGIDPGLTFPLLQHNQ